MDTVPTDQKEYVDRIFCYQGRRLDGNNKLVAQVVFIGDDGKPEDEVVHYDPKNFPPAIGGYYTVKAVKDVPTSIRVSSATFLGQKWTRTDDIVTWEAQDLAARRALAVAKRERAAAHDSEMLKCLIPIRRAWQKTNQEGRRAIEIQVLDFLRRGL